MIDFDKLLVGTANRIRNVVRFSNSTRIKDENVAEHSYYCVFYAYILGTYLNRMVATRDGIPFDSEPCKPFLNMEAVLSKALLHDMDEAVTGDFVRSFKNSDASLQHMIEQHAFKGLMPLFLELFRGMAKEYLKTPITKPTSIRTSLLLRWTSEAINAKDDSYEGQLVAFVDMLSVLSYVINEVRCGNQVIKDHLMSLREYISSFRNYTLFQNEPYAKAWLDQLPALLGENGYDIFKKEDN